MLLWVESNGIWICKFPLTSPSPPMLILLLPKLFWLTFLAKEWLDLPVRTRRYQAYTGPPAKSEDKLFSSIRTIYWQPDCSKSTKLCQSSLWWGTWTLIKGEHNFVLLAPQKTKFLLLEVEWIIQCRATVLPKTAGIKYQNLTFSENMQVLVLFKDIFMWSLAILADHQKNWTLLKSWAWLTSPRA